MGSYVDYFSLWVQQGSVFSPLHFYNQSHWELARTLQNQMPSIGVNVTQPQVKLNLKLSFNYKTPHILQNVLNKRMNRL